MSKAVEPAREFRNRQIAFAGQLAENQIHRPGKNKFKDIFQILTLIMRELFLPFHKDAWPHHFFNPLGKLRSAVAAEEDQAELPVGQYSFKQLGKLVRIVVLQIMTHEGHFFLDKILFDLFQHYVWLPIEWEGEKPVIRWQDEWF